MRRYFVACVFALLFGVATGYAMGKSMAARYARRESRRERKKMEREPIRASFLDGLQLAPAPGGLAFTWSGQFRLSIGRDA